MNKETKRIIGQLNRAYQGQAWHGPALKELISGVTAEQAVHRPMHRVHCILEIVTHCTAWIKAGIDMVGGKAVQLTPDEDWPPMGADSEAAWRQAVDDLDMAHRNLIDTLAGLADYRLQEIVGGQDYTVYFLLHGIIQHTLYHAGQIALLKQAMPRQV